MISLWTMLPLYLLGNFHCIGMCGPLVAMIGQHRFRFYYFGGRLLSFSLAGAFAGGFGAVLGALLQTYHLGAMVSLFFGTVMLLCAGQSLYPYSLPAYCLQMGMVRPFLRFITPMSQLLTPLMLQDRRFPTFLFGFFTILLPCGQTIIVYSACALLGDARYGLMHGALFALLTSPSLLIAMHISRFIPKIRLHAEKVTAYIALLVGLLAIARGFAELEWIPHLVINSTYHFVLY